MIWWCLVLIYCLKCKCVYTGTIVYVDFMNIQIKFKNCFIRITILMQECGDLNTLMLVYKCQHPEVLQFSPTTSRAHNGLRTLQLCRHGRGLHSAGPSTTMIGANDAGTRYL